MTAAAGSVLARPTGAPLRNVAPAAKWRYGPRAGAVAGRRAVPGHRAPPVDDPRSELALTWDHGPARCRAAIVLRAVPSPVVAPVVPLALNDHSRVPPRRRVAGDARRRSSRRLRTSSEHRGYCCRPPGEMGVFLVRSRLRLPRPWPARPQLLKPREVAVAWFGARTRRDSTGPRGLALRFDGPIATRRRDSRRRMSSRVPDCRIARQAALLL